jgi:hypothetical protein
MGLNIAQRVNPDKPARGSADGEEERRDTGGHRHDNLGVLSSRSSRSGTRASAGLARASAVLSVSLIARAAVAAGPPPITEDETPPAYVTPPECPARAAWLMHVRARLPPLLRTHPLIETLAVRVAKSGAATGPRYTGQLTSAADATLNSPRSLRGASCEEVLDALSFIGALGLTRVASQRGTDGITAPPDSHASGAPSGPRASQFEHAPAAMPKLRLGAVAFALLQPNLTPAQPIAFGLALRLDWSTASWQPLFLLGASASLPDKRALSGAGSVRFEHWSSHAVACPWRFPREGNLGLRPCLELDAGRSSGTGSGVMGARQRASPWLSGGAQLRGELALSRGVELGASIGAIVPFWHAHFVILPDTSFETPALGLRAGAHASLFF